MSETLLGIDTATSYASVAVTRGAELVCEREEPPAAGGMPRHSEALLPAIEGCVADAGGWIAVERICVGVGPGSYTGLRIGIATARALAQARGIPIAGVATLAALARGIAEHPLAAGRPALPLLDARRGQAGAALYGVAGEELCGPFLAGPRELVSAVEALEVAPVAAGEGSVRFAETLEAAGVAVLPPEDAVHRVAARHVCALGTVAEASSPERIEPIYLRAPDAKNWIDNQRD